MSTEWRWSLWSGHSTTQRGSWDMLRFEYESWLSGVQVPVQVTAEYTSGKGWTPGLTPAWQSRGAGCGTWSGSRRDGVRVTAKLTQRCSAVCYFGFLGSFISPCSPQPQPARFRLCFHRSSWATPSFPSSGSPPMGAFTLPHTSHTRQAGVFCFDIYILHHKPDIASNY